MADSFLLSTRRVRNGRFFAEPGPARYLIVPEGELPKPEHAVREAAWANRLRKAAIWGQDARDPRRAATTTGATDSCG